MPSVAAVGEFDAVILPRQNLSEQTQRRPVVVVHHGPAHTPSPETLRGHHLLRERNRQRTDRLHCKAARKVTLRIRLVELLGERVRGWCLVHADQIFEAPEDHVAGLRHQVFSQRAGRVRQSTVVSRTRRVQQKPRRLQCISADEDGTRSLEVLVAFRVEVHNAVRAPILAHRHARNHRAVANLRTVLQRVRHMRH